jgi:hypothetical protein
MAQRGRQRLPEDIQMLMRRLTLAMVLLAFAIATTTTGCMAPKKRWGTDDKSGADAGSVSELQRS